MVCMYVCMYIQYIQSRVIPPYDKLTSYDAVCYVSCFCPCLYRWKVVEPLDVTSFGLDECTVRFL